MDVFDELFPIIPRLQRSRAEFRPVAPEQRIQLAEEQLGFALPSILRDIYQEVGNGGLGFPPLHGDDDPAWEEYALVPYSLALRHYGEWLDSQSEGTWPKGMLPFYAWGCNVYSCVDCIQNKNPIWNWDNGICFREGRTLSTWLRAVLRNRQERFLFDVATELELDQAERELAFALPPLLRQIYREEGNGNTSFPPLFATNRGVQGEFALVPYYRRLVDWKPNRWQAGLLPFYWFGGSRFACVDCLTANYPVLGWLNNPDTDQLTPLRPSLESFLVDHWRGTDL